MPDIAELLKTGAHHPLAYFPAAVLLGGLHALEPGHSKSMMASYIIAVRGTRSQAAVLGLAASIGHTLVIWALALAGLWLGDKLILDRAGPWLEIGTGALIIVLGMRIFRLLSAPHDHDHDHEHDHDHDHSADRDRGETDKSVAQFHACCGDHGSVKTAPRQDAHACEHAAEIGRRLTGRPVSTADIAWFGLTAGLMPCPAAFAVLLVCLQTKAFGLGLALVAAFSIGLAITLVSIGVAAAWGAGKAAEHFGWLDRWGHRLPYVSAAIVVTVGAVVMLRGLQGVGVF